MTAIVSCSNPSTPSPPVPAAPTVSCPADVQVVVADGGGVAVTFPPPQAAGGSAPLTVSCATPSGGLFPLGSTPVVCTATDSGARTAQCTFRVTVTLSPLLKGTKILAFGDSITAGEVSPPSQPTIKYLDPLNSYPSVLQQSLRQRYTVQDIAVINEGKPGEQVLVPDSNGLAGEGRIERLVLQYRPDVLIVLEGVNGLTQAKAEDISEGLRRGVRRAVNHGVPLVLVSTILPGGAAGPKAPDPKAVDILNAEIRSWAGAERAVLVDMFAHIDPRKEQLIGQDGLHPTVAGYASMAVLMHDMIQKNFEKTPEATPTSARLPGLFRRERP